MKQLLLIAGAATLGMTAPALARPGHGNDHDRWGNSARNCPPGLAKKHNGCVPPGHAKRWNRGDRWRSTYGNLYTYNRIPYDIRQRYDLNSRYRYYYNDGYLYQVDPRTQLISQVISALLR